MEYHLDFRFYMVSQMANPHFSPDVQTKTNLLNFSITEDGLLAHLLSLVCRSEASKDEEERERIIRQNNEFSKKKAEIDNSILQQLRESG